MRSIPYRFNLLVVLVIAWAGGMASADDSTGMLAAAQGFLDGLRPELRERAVFPIDDDERLDWHFVPRARRGVSLKVMNDAERRATHALLRTAFSDAGYLKVVAIMALESVLFDLESRPDRPARYRDPEQYFLTVFGTPSLTDPWAWRFEGHHISVSVTCVGGRIAVTPHFLGANPGEVRTGPHAGLRVLAAEEAQGRALALSLNDGQRGLAVVADRAPRDIIMTPGRDVELDPAGVPVMLLTAKQVVALRALIELYAHRLRPDLAAKELERMLADEDELRFVWAGSMEPGEPHYYRIRGASFVIEYDNVQNGANHIHTVWRDRERDFGRDLLRAHHRDAHPGADDAPAADDPTAEASAAARIDRYLDRRHLGTGEETTTLLESLADAGLDELPELEAALRSPRSAYPDTADLIGKTTWHAVECHHVDYATRYLLYVPPTFASDAPAPVVVIGHGGNSSMTTRYAESTAMTYINAYAPLGRAMGALVIAPASTRGWGHIGNSLILSTLSDLQRRFCIDPDRIYVTGQSMGGHMSYRAALVLPDRWGAVSPHSGGYDFVEKQTIANLANVPGYAVWGKREPFGINTDNRTNRTWAVEHGLPWTFVEKNGGHEIYADELPKVAAFFDRHPRNLYRDRVYTRQGGAMQFTKTWGVAGWPKHTVHTETRPLRWNMRHWVEVEPRPGLKEPLEYLAVNRGDNRIDVVSKHVRRMRLFFHPKMIDFERPVTVVINGDALVGMVPTDPRLMFELAREYDDRGRIYWGRLEFEIDSDRDVPFGGEV